MVPIVASGAGALQPVGRVVAVGRDYATGVGEDGAVADRVVGSA